MGGRRNRNIRDHIYVLNSVVNDVINGDAGDIEIQCIDITKCFDEMNYQETHNDFWDVCPKDNKFNVITKLDEEVSVKVKMPLGDTEEFKLKKLYFKGQYLPL